MNKLTPFDGMWNTYNKERIVKLSDSAYKRNNQHTYCSHCLKELNGQEIELCKTEYYRCSDCGNKEVMNNSTPLNYLRMPIWKIGFEMEGLWKEHPNEHRLLSQHEDCSVKNIDHLDVAYVGEYVTRPVLFKNEKLEELESLVMDAYPTYVNRTCGGHFHISFRDMRFYDIAMEYDMYAGLIDHLYSWGEKKLNKIGMQRLIERIEKCNAGTDYCKPEHMPESQVSGQGDRYCQLNFDYFKHKTMEVRVLPMFSDATTYLDAVNECTTYISNYILTHAQFKKEKTIIKPEFDISGQINNIRQRYEKNE